MSLFIESDQNRVFENSIRAILKVSPIAPSAACYTLFPSDTTSRTAVRSSVLPGSAGARARRCVARFVREQAALALPAPLVRAHPSLGARPAAAREARGACPAHPRLATRAVGSAARWRQALLQPWHCAPAALDQSPPELGALCLPGPRARAQRFAVLPWPR